MVYRFVRSPEELECYDIFDENDVLIDCVAYKSEAEALVKILNEEGILEDYYELFIKQMIAVNAVSFFK